MVKPIGASLVLALLLPSTAMAQRPIVAADRIATIRLQPSVLPPIKPQRPFTLALMPAPVRAIQATPGPQPPDERSWAGRHPALLGAMIGGAAGAVVGSAGCWKSPCGDSQGPIVVALGAGIGAGLGATVGFAISLGGR